MPTLLTRNDSGFDSIAWAYEVHLRRPDPGIYNSAWLVGNEDAPDRIEFYRKASPLITDKPYVWRPRARRLNRRRRRSNTPKKKIVLELRREYLDSGGYTRRGEYFGRGAPLYYWAFWNRETNEEDSGHIRAYSRAEAKEQILSVLRSARGFQTSNRRRNLSIRKYKRGRLSGYEAATKRAVKFFRARGSATRAKRRRKNPPYRAGMAVYNRKGWVLGSCVECGALNYVEPHGTTAYCYRQKKWTEHQNIPYEYRDMSGTRLTRRPPRSNRRRRNQDGGRYSGGMLDAIRAGDRVTIVNRFGQQSTGRAVMRGPHGWVLNMGGRYGTPAIADERNIVKVTRARSRKNNPKVPPYEAKQILARLGIPIGEDFFVLSGSQVGELLAEAKRWKYRRPATASGSTARYFHAQLQRAAQAPPRSIRGYFTRNPGKEKRYLRRGRAHEARRAGFSARLLRRGEFALSPKSVYRVRRSRERGRFQKAPGYTARQRALLGNPHTCLYRVRVPPSNIDPKGYDMTISAQSKRTALNEARKWCAQTYREQTGGPMSEYRLPRGTKITEMYARAANPEWQYGPLGFLGTRSMSYRGEIERRHGGPRRSAGQQLAHLDRAARAEYGKGYRSLSESQRERVKSLARAANRRRRTRSNAGYARRRRRVYR